MNKKTVIVLVTLAVLLVVGYFVTTNSNSSQTNSPEAAPTENNVRGLSNQQSYPPADKIEVVHFHATQQCFSCLTVGKYALKTIQDKFPEEYKSGKITFKDVNVEQKENEDIVTKYQAGGSSLFVNAVIDNKNYIAEDTTVWRLVNSESQYISYFENRLKTLLGK